MPTNIDARLDAATTTVLAEISRTDAKAGVLLTSFSLPLAALVATVPGRDLPPLAAVCVGAGTVGLVAAMLTVLVVVRPRLDGEHRGSYLHWARCTPDQVLADLAAPTGQAEHVIRLSEIARRKYGGLRLAVDITGTSLVALAAALLTALL
ncbi:DUF5706 domain-containing protein [Streptomyces sp. TRM76323]|uniref:DUF5706 domain-containing protein n=1 Tax=Streptomyces tamarix TaxID=3078565 RepID=A0ABU3QUF4_9ACTN|nr:Pycsar system effector family protein [Streptomyces tamarix]MDT9686395.1 DUF5706 domain-containing protein [Streptomyces tamarix]